MKQIEIPFKPEQLGNSVSIHFGFGVHMNTPLSLLYNEYIKFCIYQVCALIDSKRIELESLNCSDFEANSKLCASVPSLLGT